MGLQDRDYYRNPSRPSTFGTLRTWSLTTWLIAINVAVFFLDSIDRGALSRLGYFSADLAIWHMQSWRLITFQFLHANIGHLFFNMLSLYFFGPMVEQYLGARRYIAFYLLCGMAGAATYLLLLLTHILIDSPMTPLVGASAGIFGILIAAATRVAPDATVMLLFPPIPMKLRTLAWVLVGWAVFTIIRNGNNAGGQAAHLGGAALGFLLIQKPKLLNVFAFSFKQRDRQRRGFKMDDWR